MNRNKISFLEKAFTFIALFLFTSAVVPLLRFYDNAAIDFNQGDNFSQAIYLTIYLITGALLLFNIKAVIQMFVQKKITVILLLLVFLCLLSFIWSSDPSITLRRSFALIGTTAFGIYLSVQFNLQQLIKILALTLASIAILSILFSIFLPVYGTHHEIDHLGAWRGVFPHKNMLGRIMTLSAIVWLIYTFSISKRKIISLAFCGLSFLLIILSTSTTAFLVCSILFG
jgi:exopolysaccharide production protein ExoQ